MARGGVRVRLRSLPLWTAAAFALLVVGGLAAATEVEEEKEDFYTCLPGMKESPGGELNAQRFMCIQSMKRINAIEKQSTFLSVTLYV